MVAFLSSGVDRQQVEQTHIQASNTRGCWIWNREARLPSSCSSGACFIFILWSKVNRGPRDQDPLFSFPGYLYPHLLGEERTLFLSKGNTITSEVYLLCFPGHSQSISHLNQRQILKGRIRFRDLHGWLRYMATIDYILSFQGQSQFSALVPWLE